jgi:hypothetical protein
MPTRTLIIRQAPRQFIVVEQDAQTLDCLVFPCRSSRAKGIHWYTYHSVRNAARESWAQRYRTIKAALADHPEAQRAPEYDLEGGKP